MTKLVRSQRQDLVERAHTFASMSEDDLKRFAAEACRDRKVAALWELTEGHLTLHGSSGARVSSHTLSTYRYGALELLKTGRAKTSSAPPETQECSGYVSSKPATLPLAPFARGCRAPKHSTPPCAGQVLQAQPPLPACARHTTVRLLGRSDMPTSAGR